MDGRTHAGALKRSSADKTKSERRASAIGGRSSVPKTLPQLRRLRRLLAVGSGFEAIEQLHPYVHQIRLLWNLPTRGQVIDNERQKLCQ